MTDEELEALLDELEDGFREDVNAALSLTAAEFADAVNAADDLVAAVFSVSRIKDMWTRRVTGLVRSLRGIVRRGSQTAAEEVGEDVPSDEDMAESVTRYEVDTTQLLNAVGDRLARAARSALAEGHDAGDSPAQLKARLVSAFTTDGSNLGPGRAERIARTEATRAWNAGQFAAGQALTGPDRPLVKQWVTRNDERVRAEHRDANGQLRLFDDPFTVGGEELLYPGDPRASADLTIQCRCIMRTATAPDERTASMDSDTHDFQSRMPDQLKGYWLRGKGAARIRWGTPGAFDRCVRELRDDFPENTEGLCANLYHEATGTWPGQNSGATEHTGAMIALVPSAADAARMAIDGGEPVEELHTTLMFLGNAADWDDEARRDLIRQVQYASVDLTPVSARAFGVARWNSDGPEPAWVWNIGDGDGEYGVRLADLHSAVCSPLYGHELIPSQHSPWSPHVTATYGDVDQDAMTLGTGPLTFDRIRVAFGSEVIDFPLLDAVPVPEYDEDESTGLEAEVLPEPPPTAPWSTPYDFGLAFENEQTGDGRVFAPGALYWNGGGPWPLQYAEEMRGGHDGARLAGAIQGIGRDGNRLTSHGVLYLTQQAGAESAMLLSQGAPLGVSVDLDDVDVEFVSTRPASEGELVLAASLAAASVMPTEDGGWMLVGETSPVMTASGSGTVFESKRVTLMAGPEGIVPFEALTAAAGHPDIMGEIVDRQLSGEFLARITRARVRGATLVSIPAYANARIVLDESPWVTAAAQQAGDDEVLDDEVAAAAKQSTDYERVLRHVRNSKGPVGAARVAQRLRMSVVAARRYLTRAAHQGEVVRLARGLYTDRTSSARADHVMHDDRLADGPYDLAASVSGVVDLPVASRDREWDGDAAKDRVFEWADGDADRIGRAFAYRDDEADPSTKGAWKLGYADVIDGELTIVPGGVAAAIGAMNGARGGVDLPDGEREAVRARLEEVRNHVIDETEDDMDDLAASAWTAMKDLPPMPADWFREPTEAELPPGGPGVNYANGRIFGWVAQAGEPHAGFAKRITIDTLGRIDTRHFLRQRFTLDDGTTVKAGAYTMDVGHHRDGAECETSACQFDDSRTVAGVVTVGMNDRGMWFSGAAAPWLSEWDRRVFEVTQPSYHMKRGPGGWELRAVLGVPVPGHSSPLLASAVFERTQLALTAAATMAEADAVVEAEEARQTTTVDVTASLADALDYERLADALVAATARAEARRAAEAAELEELLAEARTMGTDNTGTEGV